MNQWNLHVQAGLQHAVEAGHLRPLPGHHQVRQFAHEDRHLLNNFAQMMLNANQ